MKPATQSSIALYYGAPNDAKYANDGDLSTRSTTSDIETISWWQVDMQHLIQIGHIELYLQEHALKKGYYTDVYIKTRAKENDSFLECVRLGVPTVLFNTLKCSSTARYLRVYNGDSIDGLAIVEIEVYGKSGMTEVLYIFVGIQ